MKQVGEYRVEGNNSFVVEIWYDPSAGFGFRYTAYLLITQRTRTERPPLDYAASAMGGSERSARRQAKRLARRLFKEGHRPQQVDQFTITEGE